MRHPGGEVVGEVVVEHRVGVAPTQQHRHRQRTDALGDGGDGGGRRMVGVERNIADELGDRAALRRASIRGAEPLTTYGIEPATRQQQSSVDEDPRAMTDEAGDGSGAGETDQPRSLAPCGNGNTGVAQHDTDDSIGVAQHPTQRDRPTPVVRRGHDGTGDVECSDHVGKIVDPLGESATRGTLGQAHPQLVDGNHPVAAAEASQHAAPGERPRRIAVHADDRAARVLRYAGVEHVPPVALTIRRLDVDEARPRRIDSPSPPLRCRRSGLGHRRHQRSSVKLMFKPDPTPMHSTRSPVLIVDAAPAKVIGIAAGPTLPKSG